MAPAVERWLIAGGRIRTCDILMPEAFDPSSKPAGRVTGQCGRGCPCLRERFRQPEAHDASRELR